MERRRVIVYNDGSEDVKNEVTGDTLRAIELERANRSYRDALIQGEDKAHSSRFTKMLG